MMEQHNTTASLPLTMINQRMHPNVVQRIIALESRYLSLAGDWREETRLWSLGQWRVFIDVIGRPGAMLWIWWMLKALKMKRIQKM